MNDPLLHLLDRLPSGQLDEARANRIRARCHTALVRRRPAPPRDRPRGARLWTPLLAGIGGLYLTEALRHALDLYGLL